MKHRIYLLFDLGFIEQVERHDRKFRHQIAKGDERRLLVHVQKQHCCQVGHSLDVANIRSVHCESFENSLEMFVVKASDFEKAEHRKRPRNVCFNDVDTFFPRIASFDAD